jgi:hypothetical protein
MDRKENSRKRTQSTQRKFGLSIAVLSQDGGWIPRRTNSLFYSLRSLRSFAVIHFERGAWRTMATAVLGGVNASSPGRVSSLRRAEGTTGQSPLPITDY